MSSFQIETGAVASTHRHLRLEEPVRRRRSVLLAALISFGASLALGACAQTASGTAAQGKVGAISPSWSPSASRTQDDAWHFAYAVQSWAADQSRRLLRPSREVADVPPVPAGRASVLQRLHVRAGRDVREGEPKPLDGRPPAAP